MLPGVYSASMETDESQRQNVGITTEAFHHRDFSTEFTVNGYFFYLPTFTFRLPSFPRKPMITAMDLSNISNHMSKKLQAILPAIGGSHQLPTGGLAPVNLSLAENVLLREEVMTLVKASIRDTMTSKVKITAPEAF